MEKRLSESAFLGGPEYGIADMASYPWTRTWEQQGIDLTEFPGVARWREAIEARPATGRALAKADEVKR